LIAVDTGPLVALYDPRDRRHRTAVAQFAELEAETFGTCDAVLVEASFHLPWSSQRHRLRALLDELRPEPLPGTADATYWIEVLDWLIKYADQEPDWADGCLAVLCGRDLRLRVWTFDREFRTTWRRHDGTAIPMALP
jgi:predicted nucleic acid-binding protein